MYPSILDMNENDSSKYLRMLELDAYANMLAALRAQGPPTSDKLKLLKDIGTVLRISQERCKAEIRKVILDERLNTIAYLTCGQLETSDEWIKEGRRLISLMPRVAPQTLYSAIADDIAETSSINNDLPFSIHTEYKRPSTSQVQSCTSEPSRSQPFRLTETFKNDDMKKRKLPFVESCSLAQHLISPSKVSRIQQIYRQKVKTSAKEEQIKMKVKPELDHEYKHLHHQNRLIHHQQQHLAPKVQKLPLTSSSASPKINILQNISIKAPIKSEDLTDHIKLESNHMQKSIDQNHTSLQASLSNENQAPKLQKQALVNIKANANITYKHVASPGPSSEIQKSLKICATRKPLTKGITGQKLIIVSNAQSINTSSILQRTLSIPFVKNVSVKNFDKFKIVSTNTNTSTLQLTPLTNVSGNTFTTNSTKHKVVTVRTNPNKKIIPLAHLHALNAKGSIKVLPVGGKFLSKATTTSSPLYIMNNIGGIQAITKSTSSTPIVMTCRPQEPINDIKQTAKTKDITYLENNSINNFNDSNKSSVLTDILKTAEVITPNDEHISVDYETQISQFAIPQTVPEKIYQVSEDDGNFEAIDNSELIENSEVIDDSGVVENSDIIDNSEVIENCEIIDNSEILVNSEIMDNSENSEVIDNSEVIQNCEVIESTEVLDCHEDIEVSQNDEYIFMDHRRETSDSLLNNMEEDSTDFPLDSLENENCEFITDSTATHCDDIEGNELIEDSYMVEIESVTNDINAIN